MKIILPQLKENVVEIFEESSTPSLFDIDTADIAFTGTVAITTKARKEMGVLFTSTHVRVAASCVCSRCQKKYPCIIEKDFDMQYPFSQADRLIDITNDIREEVILSYPVKFLCSQNCKGLCLKCGKDLNEGVCGCAS